MTKNRRRLYVSYKTTERHFTGGDCAGSSLERRSSSGAGDFRCFRDRISGTDGSQQGARRRTGAKRSCDSGLCDDTCILCGAGTCAGKGYRRSVSGDGAGDCGSFTCFSVRLCVYLSEVPCEPDHGGPLLLFIWAGDAVFPLSAAGRV